MNSFKKGFSLTELMITVAIVSILTAIAIPSYERYVGRAKLADLFNALALGQNMVEDYLQSTGAIDCSNMAPNGSTFIQIPITSPNLQLAVIMTTPDGFGTTSCAIVAAGEPAAFGIQRSLLAHAKETAQEPSLHLVSYSIPNVQLVRPAPGSESGPGRPVSASAPILLSIPVITAGDTSWTVYSNGSSFAPASIPVLPGLSGGGGGEPIN